MKEGWEYKKLGEIGQIITGSTPSTKDVDNYSSNDYCFIKPSDIEAEGISKLYNSEFYISNKAFQNSRKLPVGAVLTTCIGIIGKVGILQINATCNQQINAIIPQNIIKSKFLAYVIKGSGAYLNQIANAPVVPIINKKAFSEVVIPVPPLTEQKRIVEELDLLTCIIEKQKQQLKELDTLAQSIFYDMFGDPVTNEKGWEVKKLEAVCKIICGQDHKPIKDESGKYPIYGSGGFMGFASQYRCPENTVIIGRKGNINNPIFVDQKFWNIDTAFGIVSDKNFLNPLFFFYFCRNYDFTKHDVSVTIPSLRRTDVLKITVPVPPLPLQNLFASKIEAIEKQKEAITKSIEETQKLFDYTMDKYFG